MKFVATKEALLDGLQRTQNVVSTRTTLPVLSNVLLETTENGIMLTTTDMEVSIRCNIQAQIERPGATTIPARKLFAIVRELPSSDITFETDSKNATSIRCGSSFFKIFGLAREEFPAFPSIAEPKEFTLKQADIKDGLRKTAYAISLDETRYVLNGILFAFKENKLTMVATDGRRLALYETDLEFPKSLEGDIIVPTKGINELQRILADAGEMRMLAGANLVSFELNGCLLVTKRVEGNYPNYRQVIPGDAKERIKLDREAFLGSVHRVALLSPDKTSSVKLTFSKNNIDISANTPEVGEAQESIAAAYRGEEFSIAFNPEFLMDPLKNLPDDEVYLDLIDELSPGVIKIKTPFLYVLMPMRVSS
jgi:DNA polymerase-3 subunit beta